ncbi:MAG TPA: hypothetical protein VJ455_02850 [Ignavibacteria bacterium]|nr:hypothetical protein [Ignavibacteria bacterium]
MSAGVLTKAEAIAQVEAKAKSKPVHRLVCQSFNEGRSISAGGSKKAK